MAANVSISSSNLSLVAEGIAERRRIVFELSDMDLPREDLVKMIRLNCKCVPERAGYRTLLDICAYGLTYGAMRSMCPECDMILHFAGDRYRCLAGMSKQSICDYERYHVKTAVTPFEIPQDVENQKLKQRKPSFENYKAVSFLNSEMTRQREKVIKDIDMHKNFARAEGREIVDEGVLYNYFLVDNLDFIRKSSHLVGQIHEENLPNKPDRFSFYKKEQIFKKSDDHCYDNLSHEAALALFKSQFLTSTGNTWEAWMSGEFKRSKKRMIPLKIDYYTTLKYEEAEEIDDLHEQLVIKLEFLKNLQIEGKQIKEELIEKAQDITIHKIMDAHVKLESAKIFETAGTYPALTCVLKNDLKSFDDKKDPDLEFFSIVARLITLPGGTTLRLVDIQAKAELFKSIQEILDVFFDYHMPVHNWPRSIADINQEYMMLKMLMVIGGWLMELVFSTDEVFHYYVKQNNSSGCCWSLLLRKAEKAFGPSDADLLILCTMDVELVSKLDMKKDIMTHKQNGIGNVLLSKLNENDYAKYGYIVHHENQAKLQMVFPIKYSKRGPGLSNKEQVDWIKFIDEFFSYGGSSARSIQQVKKRFKSKDYPYIYVGNDASKMGDVLR